MLTGGTPLVGMKHSVGAERLALPDDHFLVNLARHLGDTADPREAAAQDPSVTLDAIGWLAATSGLPVVVKGVLRADDAVACLDAGASGVVVSNRGGRQLDRAVPSAVALPSVAAAVDGRGVVLVDGGIRSGADVLTAMALGADAVLLGRPVLWALADGGQDGVQGLLPAVHDDLSHVAALAGGAAGRAGPLVGGPGRRPSTTGPVGVHARPAPRPDGGAGPAGGGVPRSGQQEDW